METPRQSSPPPILFLLLFFLASAAGASAKAYNVGDKQGWTPGVNYSDWAANNRFFVGDWLVFRYDRWNVHDVTWVNETGYNTCSSAGAMSSYSKGHSWVIQLNRTGWYYFICSRGFCYSGMKLAVLAEPLPAQAPAPEATKSGAIRPAALTLALALAAVAAGLLPFAV